MDGFFNSSFEETARLHGFKSNKKPQRANLFNYVQAMDNELENLAGMAKALVPPGQQEFTILHPHEFTTRDRD